MSSVTYAYLFDHAFEIRLVMAVLGAVAAFGVITLAQLLGNLAKSLRAKSAQSGSGRRFTSRLDAVGNVR